MVTSQVLWSWCSTHSKPGHCSLQKRMFSGHLKQLRARLLQAATVLSMNCGGGFPVRKLSSKNKLFHELPGFGPYSTGIRPENWLWERSIDDNLATFTKLMGGCPCNRLACASNTRCCKSAEGYGITSISVNLLVGIFRRTTIGKVRTSWGMGLESLLLLKSSTVRCSKTLAGEMCPDSTLWLIDNLLKFIGRLGTIPFRLLLLRCNVFSYHNQRGPECCLPNNALFDKLN